VAADLCLTPDRLARIARTLCCCALVHRYMVPSLLHAVNICSGEASDMVL